MVSLSAANAGTGLELPLVLMLLPLPWRHLLPSMLAAVLAGALLLLLAPLSCHTPAAAALSPVPSLPLLAGGAGLSGAMLLVLRGIVVLRALPPAAAAAAVAATAAAGPLTMLLPAAAFVEGRTVNVAPPTISFTTAMLFSVSVPVLSLKHAHDRERRETGAGPRSTAAARQ
jgi:hypothetical protein